MATLISLREDRWGPKRTRWQKRDSWRGRHLESSRTFFVLCWFWSSVHPLNHLILISYEFVSFFGCWNRSLRIFGLSWLLHYFLINQDSDRWFNARKLISLKILSSVRCHEWWFVMHLPTLRTVILYSAILFSEPHYSFAFFYSAGW